MTPSEIIKARFDVYKSLKQNNINPSDMITLGKAAEFVLKDKALYPMLIDKAKQLGISDVAQLNKSKVDYQVIATLITTGKLLEGK
jgi:hypothetical protein